MTIRTLRRRIGAVAILAGLALLAWVAVELLARRTAQEAGRRELAGGPTPSEVDGPPLNLPLEPPPYMAPRPKPGSVVARIAIVGAGVDAVALEGIDRKILRRAVGHFPGTALPGERGNASFAAHRDSFFRGLRHVDVGGEIEVETVDAVHLYRIEETRVVQPSQVDVIEPRGGRHLTLVTCYPFDYVGPAPQRFVVHARWVGEREPVSAPAAAAATAG